MIIYTGRNVGHKRSTPPHGEKLIVNLARDGCEVHGNVAYMDGDLRGDGELARDDQNEVVISICSHSCPELEHSRLYVQGDSPAYDDDEFSYNYGDEETAQQAITDIEKLVSMVNAS